MTVQWGVDALCRYCKGRGASQERACGHCSGTGMEPGSVAPVRRDGPETSRAAAKTVTSEKIRRSQEVILAVLRGNGPMTDEGIYKFVQFGQSPSGARTRRAELVDKGLVVDTGRTEVLSTGNRGKVWRAA